jgi:hypothetical protein
MDLNDNSSICQLDSSIDLDEKLLMFASSSVYNSKFVLRLLTSELENEESGFWTTLMKLEDKDEDKLNRPERVLKCQQMDIPKSIFQAITLLKLVHQIQATWEWTVFRKLFIEMDLPAWYSD